MMGSCANHMNAANQPTAREASYLMPVPAVSAGVVYLLPVLAISIFWNVWTGLFTAVFSAVSFNFFHIEPTGMLTINSADNLLGV